MSTGLAGSANGGWLGAGAVVVAVILAMTGAVRPRWEAELAGQIGAKAGSLQGECRLCAGTGPLLLAHGQEPHRMRP